MPNHVLNKLVVKGDINAINAMLTAVNTSNSEFDFDAICPIPAELDKASGVSGPIALENYLRAVNPATPHIMDPGYPKMTQPDFDATLGEIKGFAALTFRKERTMDDDPANPLMTQYLEAGEALIQSMKKYGYADSTDWAYDNWGCSRNSYDVDITISPKEGKADIAFCTAWCACQPLIEAFAEKYPDFDIRYDYAEEDMANQTGYAEYSKGSVVDRMEYDNGSKEAYEKYFEIWGLTPEESDVIYDPISGTYVYCEGGNPFWLGAVPLSIECATLAIDPYFGAPVVLSRKIEPDTIEKERSLKLWLMNRTTE